MKVKDIREGVYINYMQDLFASDLADNYVKDLIENKGIVVIDEIDKLVDKSSHNAKVSTEGVQYNLLPLLDGTEITLEKERITIETRNILFVGAGAFEKHKPEDLAIELQGRLPVKAKMEPLTLEDFK